MVHPRRSKTVALGLCMTCALSLECCNEGTCGWDGGQVNTFRSFV